jgi:hypothetical protein
MQENTLHLVTYGRGGRFSPYDIDKTAALLEMEDLDSDFARFENLRWRHSLAAGS